MNTRMLILLLAEFMGVVAVILIVRTSSRMKPRPLTFIYPRREGIVSLSLYTLILVGAFLYYSGSLNPIINRLDDRFGGLQQRLIFAAVCLVIFLLALVYRRQPIRSAGWGRAMLGQAFRLAVVLVFLVILLQGKFQSIVSGISTRQGQALLLLVGIGIFEETIFRGYIQMRMCGWLGRNNGLFVTTALFTLWQLPRLLLDPATLPTNLVVTVVQGLLLGWIAIQSGHVLAPAIYRAVSEWARFLSLF